MFDPESVWALLRIEFHSTAEWPLAIIPWGGDRAVIVTSDAVYLAAADSLTGFTLKMIEKR